MCSIGNVPLAAVLWNGGISFGGVVAFIFADLLILPILNIYRKYYGTAMMLTLLGTFYAAMVAAGYVVEFLFGTAGLIPSHRNAMAMEAGISWNYTTWLNIVFLGLAALLVIRFVITGGIPMLRAMGGSPESGARPRRPLTAKCARICRYRGTGRLCQLMPSARNSPTMMQHRIHVELPRRRRGAVR